MKYKSFSVFFALFLSALFIESYAVHNSLPANVDKTLLEVYQKYKNTKEGKNAEYIPELAKVNSEFFGIAVVSVNGEMKFIGDSDIPFAIESISKPFVYALALNDIGAKIITDKVGLNATGHGFNSLIPIGEKANHLQNPFVNAGSIQITSAIKGKDSAEKWERVFDFIKKLGDDKIYFSDSVYKSEMGTNERNRAIAELLNSYGMMFGDPMDALDRYTKACSIMVSARQLALMGATLANKGIHPVTKQALISKQNVQNTLSQMVINGLYENSGSWFWTVGLPAKSGVGGGILAVVPNKMAIVVFSPRLDEAGNSIRAQRVIEELSARWRLHLLQN